VKGILAMEKEGDRLIVVESVWKKVVSQFPGALAVHKFKK